jgi:hypothetical protein
MWGAIVNASDIKYRYQQLNPNGHFFDRATMKFFGDSMANFGVRKVEGAREMYHLYRKRSVKHGLRGDGWIFDDTDGSMRTPAAALGSNL